MPEISHNEIVEHLAREKTPVFLVHGDDYLVERAANAIVDALLPGPDKAACLETVDMADGETPYEVLERINTFSFFSQKKVIRLKADSLFAAGAKPEKFLEKIESARIADDLAGAANLLSTLLARQQADPRDLAGSGPVTIPGVDAEAHTQTDWLRKAAIYLLDNNITPVDAGGSAGIFKDAIENGFPENHFMIITADSVDRRSALYKTILSGHVVVNCAVAPGSRKADQDQQMRVLTEILQSTLAKHGKRAESGVLKRLYDLSGFAPRVFAGNVEKLLHFSGESQRITLQDIERVLDKTREDPIFAMTGAISEKNAPAALHYLSSLMGSGYHYMQLLSAIVNHTRKLLMVKLFVSSAQGKSWQPGMGFDRFKKQVMPQVVRYDQELAEAAAMDADTPAKSPGKSVSKSAVRAGKAKTSKKKAGTKSGSTDLAIVKNPNNPYPIYQLFLQSDSFDLAALKQFMVKLHDADIRLKTSGRTPGAVLEELIFHICGAPSGSPGSRPPRK